MKSKCKLRILARNEISNTDNLYLAQEKCCNCFDWNYVTAADGAQLVVFTEEAFNTLGKSNEVVYTAYSSLKPILEIASRIKTPQLVFSTSKNVAVSFSVTQFIQ